MNASSHKSGKLAALYVVGSNPWPITALIRIVAEYFCVVQELFPHGNGMLAEVVLPAASGL